MIRLSIILSLLLATPMARTQQETVQFDIIHNEKVIGVLQAVKKSDGPITVYENYTLVKTCIIKKIEMIYETRVVFVGNEMVEANVTTRVNGKIRTIMKTSRNGNAYQFFKNGKIKRTVSQPIHFSSVMLLFGEPKEVNRTYSEETGCFFEIIPSGTLIYQKKNGRGKTSTYSYTANVLQKIAIDGGLFNIEMISR